MAYKFLVPDEIIPCPDCAEAMQIALIPGVGPSAPFCKDCHALKREIVGRPWMTADRESVTDFPYIVWFDDCVHGGGTFEGRGFDTLEAARLFVWANGSGILTSYIEGDQ